jgi:hypothetical protein
VSPSDLVIRRGHAPARSRGLLAERTTRALAAAAILTTGAVVVGEVARVWRRGDAPLPAETDDVVLASEQAN